MWAWNRGLGIHMENSATPLVKVQDWFSLSELYLDGNRILVWWKSNQSFWLCVTKVSSTPYTPDNLPTVNIRDLYLLSFSFHKLENVTFS